MRIRPLYLLLVALAGAGCASVEHANSATAEDSAFLAAEGFPVGEARAIPVHEPLLAATGGGAPIPPNSIDVGLVAGYAMLGDVDTGDRVIADFPNAVVLGARFGYHITEKHGIDATLTSHDAFQRSQGQVGYV